MYASAFLANFFKTIESSGPLQANPTINLTSMALTLNASLSELSSYLLSYSRANKEVVDDSDISGYNILLTKNPYEVSANMKMNLSLTNFVRSFVLQLEEFQTNLTMISTLTTNFEVNFQSSLNMVQSLEKQLASDYLNNFAQFCSFQFLTALLGFFY